MIESLVRDLQFFKVRQIGKNRDFLHILLQKIKERFHNYNGKFAISYNANALNAQNFEILLLS